jgi:hypothetical protein
LIVRRHRITHLLNALPALLLVIVSLTHMRTIEVSMLSVDVLVSLLDRPYLSEHLRVVCESIDVLLVHARQVINRHVHIYPFTHSFIHPIVMFTCACAALC